MERNGEHHGPSLVWYGTYGYVLAVRIAGREGAEIEDQTTREIKVLSLFWSQRAHSPLLIKLALLSSKSCRVLWSVCQNLEMELAVITRQ